jgi:hypothetical protein
MSYRTCDQCSRFYLGPAPNDPLPEPSCRCCRRPLRSCSIGEVRDRFPFRSAPQSRTALLTEEDDEIG